MIPIDTRSPIPLYEQVKTGLRELVSVGVLKPGDAVPPIKTLAESLLVSPKTVARAYKDLTAEGFLQSKAGGVYISKSAGNFATDTLRNVCKQLIDAVQSSHRAGLTWKDIESILHMVELQETPGRAVLLEELPEILKRLEAQRIGEQEPEEPARNLVTLVRYLQGYRREGDSMGEAMCPYCREGIGEKEAIVSCKGCKTIHHQECWDEAGRCSVFGCKGFQT